MHIVLKKKHIDALIELTTRVGEEVMKYYHSSDLQVEHKKDNSPVTAADKRAHQLITEYLTAFLPFRRVPVISEEGDEALNALNIEKYDTYWLIDPIDGTASFINKTGDFTINIALIVKDQPVFGIIHQPMTRTSYYTTDDGAYKLVQGSEPSVISVNQNIKVHDGIRLVTSTKDFSEREMRFFESLNVACKDRISSSLKFCLVAEGKYDAYFHFSDDICIWDIAAGHAILLKAGGVMYDALARYQDDKILDYSRHKRLRRFYFVSSSSQIAGYMLGKVSRMHSFERCSF
ncbi:3'(2'),5'-bisphosphate nucleotidase CysQ [Rickettsiales endosymbiont of Peranema trichophorum]|uniref:3'(2'),5'-bisphosphate nucleotidase CysQ family protein n=1 Tax=Rickettsiales endosymbiont of Peranema trichophorum TaxID=2486577 RepID=UPI00102348F8|nr:3'(2'),5'-bisphosphate nucleotidase CysQ [Rickettsiales endosymbiont of Peranema trichophorum]RZI45087.1 3'(2'),5'-bisphosphate nucleotidase CysQ [Rickettsiales endosymbiont of Peranema trichophorum]